MAAADPSTGDTGDLWDPHANPSVYKSNVTQTEYTYKHRIFFEDVRRAELRRRRRSGEPVKNVPIQRMHSFTPIDEGSTCRDSKGALTRSWSFSVDIPTQPHSITNVEHAELHLHIIPTACTNDRQVTLQLQGEVSMVHVDACRPRWESLSIPPLPAPLHAVNTLRAPLRSINVTCTDCLAQNVALSTPYLNVVTSTTRKNRYPRRVRNRERRKCRLSPLVIDFKELPSFKAVTSPRTVDIGRCRGSCTADFRPHSQHAFFRYDLAKIGKGPLPCCAPSKYRDLEYLMPNNTHLQKYHWPDAIAIQCSCH